MQNQARDSNLFDYFYAKPAPIAPQSLTREIPERSDSAGHVLVAARSRGGAARRARTQGRRRRSRSRSAICSRSSTRPHEQETRALIQAEFPGVHVSLSSEVLPRIREWPRLSTTLVNAYLEPVLVRYIDHLDRGPRSRPASARSSAS